MIGNSEVGKTSLIHRYINNEFLQQMATIGVEFEKKKMIIDKKEIEVKIFDTAGQERFHNIVKQYYQGSDIILIVFALNQLNSGNEIKYWMSQIQDKVDINDITIGLCGNKSDLEDSFMTKDKDVEKLWESLQIKNKLRYFKTSASKGDGVHEMFNKLINEGYKKKLHVLKHQSKGENDFQQLSGKKCSKKKDKKSC
jgi:small GTP-binding protein